MQYAKPPQPPAPDKPPHKVRRYLLVWTLAAGALVVLYAVMQAGEPNAQPVIAQLQVGP